MQPSIALFNANKIKAWIMIAVSTIIVFVSMFAYGTQSRTTEAQAFDVVKYAMCTLAPEESGMPQIYQYTQTSDLQFLLRSKSTMNTGTDRVDSGLNMILDATTGYDRVTVNESVIGRSLKEGVTTEDTTATEEKQFNSGVKVNPFDRFGVAGLKFTSYIGEWKYYIVDACGDDNANPQDPKANLYYDSRLEPKSTWEEIPRTQDVRTAQFNRGLGEQIKTSMVNVVSNWAFFVVKLVVVLTIGAIGVTFADVPAMFGLTELLGGSNGSNGLFSNLFNNLFIPMSVLVVLLVGAGMLANLVYSRNRFGFMQILRMVIMYLVSFIIAANPLLLMNVPNNIAIFTQSLVAQSLSPALGTQNGICETNIGEIEVTNTTTGENEQLSELQKIATTTQSQIGCVLWEQLLLRPWAQGQYGTTWNYLWGREATPEWAKQVGPTGEINNENFTWVGQPKVPVGNGEFIENWAVFQISAQTDAHSPVNKDGEIGKITSGISNDWWRIVDALSNYDEKGEKQEIQASGNSEWVTPAVGANTSGFGPRSISIDPSGFHYGSDIGAQCGEPVYAASEGTVVFAGTEDYGGQFIAIKHPKDNVDTAYAHMEVGSLTVKAGDTVKAGQQIAKVSNTGLPGMGCHLHFEVRQPSSGNWAAFDSTIDPVPFMKERGVEVGVEGSSGSGGNRGTSGEITVNEPIYNTPSTYWEYWTGNTIWNRLGTALSALMIAVVSLLPIALFSFLSAIYALILPILMILLPMMLLLSLGTERFFNIFVSYMKGLGYYMMLRIIYGSLSLLSIIMINIALGYMATVGWWLGIMLLILFSLILLRFSKKIRQLMMRSQAFASQFTGGEEKLFGGVQKLAKGTVNTASSGIIGGVQSKRYGGSFIDGVVNSGRKQLKNELYRGKSGGFLSSMRVEMDAHAIDTLGSQGFKQKQCASCGKSLADESGILGRDSAGNFYCQVCFDDGLAPADAREVEIDIEGATRNRQKRETSMDEAVRVSKLSAADTNKNRAEATMIRTGVNENGQQLTDDERKQSARRLMLASGFDIAKAEVRDMLGKNGEISSSNANVNVKAPNELRPYLDLEQIERAFREGNFGYVQKVYVAGWAQWLHDTTGLVLAKDQKDLEALDKDMDRVVRGLVSNGVVERDLRNKAQKIQNDRAQNNNNSNP